MKVFLLRTNREVKNYVNENLNGIFDFVKKYSRKSISENNMLHSIDDVLTNSNYYIELRDKNGIQGLLAATIIQCSPSYVYINYHIESFFIRKTKYAPFLLFFLYKNLLLSLNNPIIVFCTWLKKTLEKIEKMHILSDVTYSGDIYCPEFIKLLQNLLAHAGVYFNKKDGNLYTYDKSILSDKIFYYTVNTNVLNSMPCITALLNIYEKIEIEHYNSKRIMKRVIITASDLLENNFSAPKRNFFIRRVLHKLYIYKILRIADFNSDVTVNYAKNKLDELTVTWATNKGETKVKLKVLSSKKIKGLEKSNFSSLYLKDKNNILIPSNNDFLVDNSKISINDFVGFINYITEYHLLQIA